MTIEEGNKKLLANASSPKKVAAKQTRRYHMKGQIVHIRVHFDVIHIVHILELIIVNEAYLRVRWQLRASQEILGSFLVRASTYFYYLSIYFKRLHNMVK